MKKATKKKAPAAIKLKPVSEKIALLRGEFQALPMCEAFIQESSLAITPAIWLGPVRGGALLLAQAHVAALLPHLKRFIKTGKLG